MAKIKGVRKLTKKQKELKKLIPDVKKEFKKKGPKNIRTQIVADILRGTSPVNGKGKFKKYSDSYKEQIKGKTKFFTKGGKVIAIKAKRGETFKKPFPGKKISPVNMKQSKAMLNKLYVKVPIFRRGLKLVIGIKHKLADIHNRLGAAGKTVRRLLPTKSGENFNHKITRQINNELEKSIKKVVNRLNRK